MKRAKNSINPPLLTVCLITYNHFNYIIEAVESVLNQEVDFSWHLVIADDFSTDGTREILLNYKEKHPAFITLILQEKNVGAAKNWMDLMVFPNSKYIAYFEGDDYWTNPLKLQKQVDLLEGNLQYSISAHATNILSPSNKLLKRPYQTKTYKFIDFIKETKIGSATCSIVFRNNLNIFNSDFWAVVKESGAGDWLLIIACLKNGDMHFSNNNMATYRRHKGGVYSSKNLLEKYKIHLSTALSVDKLTHYKYHNTIINFNVRKIFLLALENESEISIPTMIEIYKNIDFNNIRKYLTLFLIRSPLKLFFLKHLSKAFFISYKIRTK